MWCKGQDLCSLEEVETQMWCKGQDLCSLEGWRHICGVRVRI